MRPPRWNRITACFSEAVELDPAERERYLTGLREKDAELEQEVRSLLVASRGQGPFDDLLEYATGPGAAALLEGDERVDGVVVHLRRALEDRYEVEGLLGRGGMAVVCLARDDKHRRQVAIKVLRPELAAVLGAERFLREIEIAAGLNHPNILGLHDSGEADGLLYFVMPYVEGDSLRDRLAREGPMPVEDATRVVREVGSALSFAHGLGLVHRDVKPENILFQAGHALVCDFGIAKAASEAQDRLTQTGLAIGTWMYMSPEQITESEAVDGRADLYALGCMFYEMLTGSPPYPGGSARGALARRLSGPPPPASDLREDVPATVSDVIARALAASPDERYQTADEMIAALELASTRAVIEADARRRRYRRLGRYAAGALALAAVAGAGLWVSSLAQTPRIERVALLPALDASDPGQEFFVQGVNQDLALELAKAGVRVKSPSSVSRFVGTDAPLGVVADSLDVDGIVQVSGALTDDHAEIALALVDGTSEELLWVREFQGPQREILTLYSDITRAIAGEIGLTLSDEVEARLAAAAPVDPAVYEALRNARFHWQTLTAEGLDTALDYYELATRLDSTSVEAWIGIGHVWLTRAQQGLISAEEANRMAEPATARAAALDPLLPEVQASIAIRATWGEWDWDAAEAAFVRALDRDPLDAVTRAYYSLLLLYLGRVDESVAEIERAVETDPYNTLIQGLRAQNLNARRLYGEAEASLQDALARDRGAPFLLSTLRTTYHLMGRYEEALDMWRASFTQEGSYAADGDPAAVAALDAGYRRGGYEGALRAVAELFAARAQTEHIAPWRLGTLYTRAGMRAEALTYLEAACDAARDQNCPYLSIDPIFDFLRDDPRFQALVDALGLEA